ncbi:MogA/MoaB family molybdenum cofactor biosynthesis protein [Corynebacterium anserum]|uniref:MogA/MoaB family molybdenum cofactor biosynthesis protein n=1 Tax=Corynebacterium anserum TaxID=2684406 RepID=A0A7G7YPI6_9CORY|nr:molybdopterin-binding protein [Corynebacterium anserum]MBC2682036.1 MogA/MoaB family molybdenum cofactor biosynthesis protein [Corynebacterium anserum]QNH96406.1 MogA/MoaB family molybdenum cofactor biosynthesis protein [Corynebacterium anserum]
MSPQRSQQGHDTVHALPSMDSVNQADIDRLEARVEEPDDELFRELDAQARTENAAPKQPLLHAMVVIITDNDEDTDQSGELVTELLTEENFIVDALVHVEARKPAIRKAIQTAVVGGADLVITVGATGMGPRDKAPEAANAEMDRKVPGLAEALRSSGLAANSLEAGLSRGVAGISGSTLVVNLANTRGAIRDGMATLCPLARHVIADMNR